MKLAVLLAATGAIASLPPASDRRARYATLPADEADPNFELIFSNVLWRHGDRAPTAPVPGRDVFSEDDWTFGGSGYGALSPEGMKQHFNLGRKIRKRYVDEHKMLSSAYNAKEIYVRSTDHNRTLVSAYANLAGMYSGFGVAGQHFPSDVPDWPSGYVPIPVHTVALDSDRLLRPGVNCKRDDELYAMIQNSPEFQDYVKDPKVSEILKYLSKETETDVNIDNIFNVKDPIYCESMHIEQLNQTGANIETFYPWFFKGDVAQWADIIQSKDDDFNDGLGNPNGVNDIDVSIELPKIRGGDALKLVVDNVHGVLSCRDNETCGKFYEKLKYYALSGHDSTMNAFLAILGVRKFVIPDGQAQYSAAVFVEVYEDKNSTDRYFKVLYHADENDGFKSFTGFVRGCNSLENFCSISVLDDLVKKYAPETDMETLCNTPVFANDPGDDNTEEPATTTSKPTVPPTTTSSSTLLFYTSAVIVALFTGRF